MQYYHIKQCYNGGKKGNMQKSPKTTGRQIIVISNYLNLY